MQVNSIASSNKNYGASVDLVNIVGANYGTLGGLLGGANTLQNGNFFNLLSGILGENQVADTSSNTLQNVLNTLGDNSQVSSQVSSQTNPLQNLLQGNEILNLPNFSLSSILNEASKSTNANFVIDNKLNKVDVTNQNTANKNDVLNLLTSIQNKFNIIKNSLQLNEVKVALPKSENISVEKENIIENTESLISSIDEFFNFLKKVLRNNQLGISDNEVKDSEYISNELDSINSNINTQVNVFVQFVQAFNNEVKTPEKSLEKSLENISNNLSKASKLFQEKLPTLSSDDLNNIYQKLENINRNLSLIENNINDAQKTINFTESENLNTLQKVEGNNTEKSLESNKVNNTQESIEKLISQSKNSNSNNNSAENNNQNQAFVKQDKLIEDVDKSKLEVKFEIEDKEIIKSNSSSLIDNEILRNVASVSHTKTETSINSVSNQVLVKIENYFENGVKSGEQKFEIELFPKDLGKITVEIDISKNGGENKIHITAENKSAFEALKNDRASIEKIFENNNLKLDNTNLSFDLRNNNQFAEQQARRQYFETLQNDFFANSSNSVSANLINDAVIASRSYSSSLSLIDIMV
jgi:hypothetical protein